MKFFRLVDGLRTPALAMALVALVAWPLLAIALGSGVESGPSVAVGSGTRTLELAGTTLKLVGLTELFALGLGLPLAFGLSRTDLPGRRGLGLLVGVGLFIPLPLQALAWLGSFGNVGRSQAIGSGPILTGLVGASVVHAIAAVPWVVWIASAGFRAADARSEELALLDRPAWAVAARVTTREAAAAIGSAALAVAVLTAGEMTVTDLIPLRTFAEETYTLGQLGLGPGRIAAWVALPQTIFLAGLIVLAIGAGRRAAPGRVAEPGRRSSPFRLGPWRAVVGVVAWSAVGLLAGLPIYGMAWRAGRVGSGLEPGRGASWSLSGLSGTVRAAWGDLTDPGGFGPGRVRFGLAALAIGIGLGGMVWVRLLDRSGSGRHRIAPGLAVGIACVLAYLTLPGLARAPLPGSLLAAGLGASGAVAIAWGLAWRGYFSRAWRAVAIAAVAIVLATPGPVAGLALKLAYIHAGFLNRTPFLMVLGLAVRSLPYALLMIAPSIAKFARSEAESAVLEGLNRVEVADLLIRPGRRGVLATAYGLAFAVGIGELAASYLLRAPGYEPVSVYLWSMLHVGVESRLAGVGLVLLTISGIVGVGSLWAASMSDE